MFEPAEIKGAEGNSVYYTDDGDGFPLLFVHGWLMSSRVWALQAPLSAGFRVITIDLRGHGLASEAKFSYEGCCHDISLLFDRLGLDRAIVVGWSMGAQISLKAFPCLRDRIAGIMLVGGTPRFCSNDDFTDGLPPSEARLMALRIRKNYIGAAGEFFRSMFSGEDGEKVDIGQLASRVASRLPSAGNALTALNELTTTDQRADLSSISAPVLLVHGALDKICLLGASEFMARNLPSAEIEVFPSAGHAPFLSDPVTFNQILTCFVQVVHGQN